jgi:hypothetical protein
MPTVPHSASGLDNFVTNLPIVMLKELEVNPPDMVRSLYVPKPWNPAEGDRVTFDSYALPTYAERVGENESYPIVGITEGDSMTVNQIQYGVKFDYTVRMDKFDKLQLATRVAARMSSMLNMTLDLEMTHKAISDAEDTTYTPRNQSAAVGDPWLTADDVAFVSTTHTVNATPAPGNKSNSYTTACAFSPDSITAIMAHGDANFLNDDGVPVSWNPNETWINQQPYMVKRGREIFGSQLTPLSSNNAVNVFGPNNDWNMKLVVFKKGLIGADGKTRRTGTTDLYRFGLYDSAFRENLQVQIAGDPKLRVQSSSNDNALASILFDMFAAFVSIRWQGYVLAYSGVTQPA